VKLDLLAFLGTHCWLPPLPTLKLEIITLATLDEQGIALMDRRRLAVVAGPTSRTRAVASICGIFVRSGMPVAVRVFVTFWWNGTINSIPPSTILGQAAANTAIHCILIFCASMARAVFNWIANWWLNLAVLSRKSCIADANTSVGLILVFRCASTIAICNCCARFGRWRDITRITRPQTCTDAVASICAVLVLSRVPITMEFAVAFWCNGTIDTHPFAGVNHIRVLLEDDFALFFVFTVAVTTV
jgi:hypothetical protein